MTISDTTLESLCEGPQLHVSFTTLDYIKLVHESEMMREEYSRKINQSRQEYETMKHKYLKARAEVHKKNKIIMSLTDTLKFIKKKIKHKQEQYLHEYSQPKDTAESLVEELLCRMDAD